MDNTVMGMDKCRVANIPGAVVEPMKVKRRKRLNPSTIEKLRGGGEIRIYQSILN